MSRLSLYLRGVIWSYAALIGGVLYGFASVPLALAYLSREEFGLWMLVLQLAGYLELVDMGMSSSISRHLIDDKDRVTAGDYGSLIQIGGCVLAVQGVLVAVLGVWGSGLFAQLLAVPANLQSEFMRLFGWYAVFLGIRFASRIFDHILYAHQRIDLSNCAEVLTNLLMYAVLWLAFAWGQGVYAMLWARGFGMATAMLLTLTAVVRLRLLPAAGQWGRPRWTKFKALFCFGMDMFLIAVGTQLILFSQNIILSRTLGLGAVAAWSVGTRLCTLLWQFIWRIYDSSHPALSEMIARGETDRLRARFQDIMRVSMSVAAVGAMFVAVGNADFVTVWTGGKITWPSQLDWLLGVWLIVQVLEHAHSSRAAATKVIGFMRWLYPIEGVTVVSLSYGTVKLLDTGALIVAAIVCTLCFRGTYGVYRTMRDLGFSLRAILWEWQKPMLQTLVWLVPVALAIASATQSLEVWPRLFINVTTLTVVAAYTLVRHGIPRPVLREIAQRLPPSLGKVLGLLFPK